MAVEDIKRAEDQGCTQEHLRALESIWRILLREIGERTDVGALAAQAYDIAEAFMGARRANGVRGQTICREVAALKRALAIAHRRGLIATLPVHWPRVRPDAPCERARGKFVEPEQLEKVLSNLPDDVAEELKFAALTGLRGSELKRVTVEWGLHESGRGGADGRCMPRFLRIPAASTKSRRERRVAPPIAAAGILVDRGRLVPRGSPLFPRASHRRTIAKASQLAGLQMPLTVRDLRHTYGTLGLAKTCDPAAVQAALGHVDLKTTQRYISSTHERTMGVGLAVAQAMADALTP